MDPIKQGPWIHDLCQHEQQHNKNSDQDEEALQDKLESLLVFDPVELYRLRRKARMRERSNQEVTAHLDEQEHPGDAEADEGAPNKAGHPIQSEH